MATHWLLLALAIATGMFIPLQPGINAALRLHTGSPFIAALVSFAGGTLILAAIVLWIRLVQRPALPSAAQVLAQAPWWSYLGGAVGAMFVTVSLVLAPKLGAAVLVAGIVTGQLLGSVVIDQFGLVNFPRVQLTWPRLVGVGLLIAGVLVMQVGTANRSGSN